MAKLLTRMPASADKEETGAAHGARGQNPLEQNEPAPEQNGDGGSGKLNVENEKGHPSGSGAPWCMFFVLMDAATVVYQKDGEVAVWQEGGAMLQAMVDDCAAEVLDVVGRNDTPQLPCKSDVRRLTEDVGTTA